MRAAESTDLAEKIFRELLSAAIARGRRPHHTAALGPTTWLAIDALAREHPEATPDHIVAAHDAFNREHRGTPCTEYSEDQHTARAAEYAAIDNLVAQLRITYPTVAPEAIAIIVRRIHADFDTNNDRDFIPLFIEQAVREHLA